MDRADVRSHLNYFQVKFPPEFISAVQPVEVLLAQTLRLNYPQQK